jgi:ABC-type antimicrobial peptide transport system permease subunit
MGVGSDLAGAFALRRLPAAYLDAVRPTATSTLAFIVLAQLIIAALASLIPARRATKFDPMVTLRYG